MSSTIKLPKFCNLCGKAFIAQKTTTQFCSLQCAQRAYKQRKRAEKVNDALAQEHQKIVSKPNRVPISENAQNSAVDLTIRDKEFLSISEVSKLLGASRWTIQRMIKSSRLPVAKIGSRTVIQRRAIDNLFN